MVITRTPFRVSLAGGGSDLREYYAHSPYGAVVSAAIQSYMYIVIHPYFHDKIRIKYARTEDVTHVDEIQHPIVRAAMRRVSVGRGVEIASFADVPAGTGLGSSSAFTVGLLHALYAFRGMTVSREELAAQACELEIDTLGEPIGKQDQYAAAFGGLNYIRFNPDESVNVAPISLDQAGRADLEARLRLYFIGGQRSASAILKEQEENMRRPETRQHLDRMVALADDLRDGFHRWQVDRLGACLEQGWRCKRALAPGISTGRIDDLLARALRLGAGGGKVLGAGGNGFLLLFADNHEKIAAELGCRTLPFRIDETGSSLIFNGM